MSVAVECETRRKRTLLPLLLDTSTSVVDFEPRCAKRTCPNLPCSINYCIHPHQDASYCMHPQQDACSSQAKHDEEDSEFGWAHESEAMGADADECAIREMMCSLEQAITNDECVEESSSSSPLTSSTTTGDASASAGGDDERQLASKLEYPTSESECSFKFVGDGRNASIDDEIQQLLQQVEDQNFISNFCESWDNCRRASSSSDYLNIANSPVYPYDDELGVVYNPLLDPDSECSFDFL